MRVACIDAWGCATSWWLRLKAEGADIRVYVDGSECPNTAVGDGLVPKETSYERIVSWAQQSPADTIVLFCQNAYGEKADALRKSGLYVVGGGEFADEIEHDRILGFDIAKEIGLGVPPFEQFATLTDAIDGARKRRDGAVFKTNDYIESDSTQVCERPDDIIRYCENMRARYRNRIPCILQDLVGGKDSADFDIARWWDGREWVGPYQLTMEKKRFMNGDFGPSTGCALNCVWFEDEPSFAAEIDWARLGEIFLQKNAPPCIYAINTRISDEDGRAYFLEFTSRLGFDSEPTAALLYGSLSDFLWRAATGQGGTEISPKLAYGVRLSVPPYPHEGVTDGEHSAKRLLIPSEFNGYEPPFVAYQIMQGDKEFEVASPEGIVGLAAAVGDDLGKMHEQVIEFADDLHKGASKLQLRTDGDTALQKDARKLVALGIDIHPAVLKSAAEEAA